MATTPSPTEQLQAFINRIRRVMRDYPKLNLLIQGQENGDRDIAIALQQVMDYVNGTPPLLSSQWSWHSFPNQGLLINGVIAKLQQSVADLDDRNYFPASDGQSHIPSRQKGQIVRRSADYRWQYFVQDLQNFKVAYNISVCMGGKALASDEGAWNNSLNDYIYNRNVDLAVT